MVYFSPELEKRNNFSINSVIFFLLEMSESKDALDGEDFLEVAVENDNLHASSGTGAPSSPLLKGMDLDLSLASRKNDSRADNNRVQEGNILVNFDLPDGSQGESSFKLGQTVEVLKSFVESEFGIPMELQVMYLNDSPMMNPLSLLDFSEAKGAEEIFIRVDGPMNDNTCKK